MNDIAATLFTVAGVAAVVVAVLVLAMTIIDTPDERCDRLFPNAIGTTGQGLDHGNYVCYVIHSDLSSSHSYYDSDDQEITK